MRKLILSALSSAAVLVATGVVMASPASASLIFDDQIVLGAQGFGNAPRDLTVQASGNSRSPAGTESGCVGVSGSSINVGGCMGTDAGFDPNGVINQGGDEPNPLDDNQKYGVPTAASLGITSAADIGILFNATEPSGDSINVADITLKIYSSTGTLLGSIDGSNNFASSVQGNGSAGFVFRVSNDEQAYVNGLLANGNTRFALEATLTNVAGGPDTFKVVNIRTGAVPEPGTWAMMLVGFGAVGYGMRRRKRAVLQAA